MERLKINKKELEKIVKEVSSDSEYNYDKRVIKDEVEYRFGKVLTPLIYEVMKYELTNSVASHISTGDHDVADTFYIAFKDSKVAPVEFENHISMEYSDYKGRRETTEINSVGVIVGGQKYIVRAYLNIEQLKELKSLSFSFIKKEFDAFQKKLNLLNIDDTCIQFKGYIVYDMDYNKNNVLTKYPVSLDIFIYNEVGKRLSYQMNKFGGKDNKIIKSTTLSQDLYKEKDKEKVELSFVTEDKKGVRQLISREKYDSYEEFEDALNNDGPVLE